MTLLSQLSQALGAYLCSGSSLEDILVANNTGFPLDMFEDCGSKKPKSVAKKEHVSVMHMNGFVGEDLSMKSPPTNSPASATALRGGGQCLSSQEALKVLIGCHGKDFHSFILPFLSCGQRLLLPRPSRVTQQPMALHVILHSILHPLPPSPQPLCPPLPPLLWVVVRLPFHSIHVFLGRRPKPNKGRPEMGYRTVAM